MKTQNLNQAIAEIVIPGNNPVHVVNTSVNPYCFVGLLQMRFPNGTKYYGTATLIADEGAKDGKSRHLLTCAHNLYDEADGGRAVSVEFTPMYNGEQAYTPVQAASYYYPVGYSNVAISRMTDASSLSEVEIENDIEQDYAIVKLESYIDAVGAPSTYALPDSELQNAQVELNGYGYFDQEMSHATGAISVVTENTLKYPISTKQGASGTAIMKISNAQIVGIHTRGLPTEELNQGVRITNAVQADIQAWLLL